MYWVYVEFTETSQHSRLSITGDEREKQEFGWAIPRKGEADDSRVVFIISR
jgi:hypothetical protein